MSEVSNDHFFVQALSERDVLSITTQLGEELVRLRIQNRNLAYENSRLLRKVDFLTPDKES